MDKPENKRLEGQPIVPHENNAEFYDFAYEKSYGPVYRRLTDLSMAAINRVFHKSGIIDYGAGTGRLAIPLANTGYKVYAVEPCREMAQVLERKALEAGLDIPVHLKTISGYEGEDADLALAVFTVMSYITDEGEMRRSLANIHRHLLPEGLFLFDLPNDIFFNTGVLMDMNMDILKRRVEITRSEGNVFRYMETISGILDGIHFGPIHEDFPIRRWTWLEMDAMLVEAGFRKMPIEFPEFAFSAATYRLYQKQ